MMGSGYIDARHTLACREHFRQTCFRLMNHWTGLPSETAHLFFSAFLNASLQPMESRTR